MRSKDSVDPRAFKEAGLKEKRDKSSKLDRAKVPPANLTVNTSSRSKRMNTRNGKRYIP